MAKDEFKNLGFDEGKGSAIVAKKVDGQEEGKKGELRW